MRYRQEKSSGAVTYYVDKLMEIEFLGTAVDYRHYLGDVAIVTKTGSLNDPTPGYRYTFRDLLGSTVAMANESGLLPEYRGFDAYGKPRNGDWTDKSPATINSAVTDRGFTDHEHLDEWQLIHMNGRGYDYNLGRFISIDPFIVEPGNSQAINPYSYILNNPLSGTDPSGYLADTFWDAASIVFDIGKIGVGIYKGDNDLIDEGLIDLAADAAALVIPFVPAGATKVARHGDDVADGLNDARKAKNADNPSGGSNKPDNGADGSGNSTGNANSTPDEIGGSASRADRPSDDAVEVKIDKNRHPESAQHAEDAINSGHPDELTIDRSGAQSNRRDALDGTETRPGKDRDEYPPSMFEEGGEGASVRHIDPSDNRGAGSCIGHQCRPLPDGTKVKIVVEE